MKTALKLLVTICLLAAARCSFASPILDSLVVITTRIGGTDDARMGTGTIISDSGDVLTAYHVVQDAKSITVTNQQRQTFPNISVLRWDVRRDLAIIHINEPGMALSSYPVADSGVNIQPGTAAAYGHAAGFYFSQFPTSIVHTPILSREVRDPDTQREIFAVGTVSLIPIDLTIFGGLSGGPLVVGDRIIGVISGSLTQGGSIGWAIPVTPDVLAGMDTVQKSPGSIAWPALALMRPGTKLVRAQVSLGTELAQALDGANAAMDPLGLSIPVMEQACRGYRSQLITIIQAADRQIAVDPNEAVNTFTADAQQAPSWGNFVAAEGDCMQKLNTVNAQTNTSSQASAKVTEKFYAFAGQFPDTPENQVVDNKMAAQGAENGRIAAAILDDTAKFSSAAQQLTAVDIRTVADARANWAQTLRVMEFVVPRGGSGIMRRNFEQQKKIGSELELIFDLTGAPAAPGQAGS